MQAFSGFFDHPDLSMANLDINRVVYPTFLIQGSDMAVNKSVDVLQLSDDHFVIKGKHCMVYRHPDDKDWLIKILLPRFQSKEQNHSTQRRFKALGRITWLIKRYRFSKLFVREFLEIVHLRFNPQFRPLRFMQKMIGFTDTNLGFGFLVKAEKGKDGHYAKTLKSILREHSFNDDMRDQLAEFYKHLLDHNIVVSDLHAGNIVYSYDKEYGEYFVLIDGVGDKTLIPLLRLSSYLRKRATQRKIKRLDAFITSFIDSP